MSSGPNLAVRLLDDILSALFSENIIVVLHDKVTFSLFD